jgi:hypothetical protein
MSNPFHSFHVQKGGVPLQKVSKHYRKLSKNKFNKFQPLTLQDKEDLVIPMDLLHVPHHHCYAQYSEHHQPPMHGTLEIIRIHTPQQEQSYEHPPVISDEQFEELFQHISTAPRSKKHFKTNQTLKKQKRKQRKTRKPKRV